VDVRVAGSSVSTALIDCLHKSITHTHTIEMEGECGSITVWYSMNTKTNGHAHFLETVSARSHGGGGTLNRDLTEFKYRYDAINEDWRTFIFSTASA
jgi:hypothetical protein